MALGLLASDGVYNAFALLQRGQLLKLTFSTCLSGESGVFSVALSVALRPPVFHWHLSLRSPDFPLLPGAEAIACFPKKYVIFSATEHTEALRANLTFSLRALCLINLIRWRLCVFDV